MSQTIHFLPRPAQSLPPPNLRPQPQRAPRESFAPAARNKFKSVFPEIAFSEKHPAGRARPEPFSVESAAPLPRKKPPRHSNPRLKSTDFKRKPYSQPRLKSADFKRLTLPSPTSPNSGACRCRSPASGPRSRRRAAWAPPPGWGAPARVCRGWSAPPWRS